MAAQTSSNVRFVRKHSILLNLKECLYKISFTFSYITLKIPLLYTYNLLQNRTITIQAYLSLSNKLK